MKRVLTGILAALLLFALLPAQTAKAAVLNGYTSKVDYDNTDPGRYRIDVDLVNQIFTVYQKGPSGAYDGIVLQTLCTTGNEENPTGSGTYKLGSLKERFGYFVAYNEYAQYWSQVVRGVYIHSVLYSSKNIASMSRGAYNGLGKNLSHGCIRVLPNVAKWVFYNCPPGTACVISKNRAPNPALAKSLKAAIPSYASYRLELDFKTDPPVVAAAAVTDNVPVRTGFSAVKDTTVYTLKTGEAVKILQLGPDWCKVRTGNGTLGYVQTKYLLMDPSTLIPVHPTYTAREATALYKAPDTKAAALATFQKGAKVEVIGTVDKYWLTAKAGDNYGFVRAKYLSAAADAASSGSVQPPSITNVKAQVKPGIIAVFRAGPGMSFPELAELAEGTPVTLVSAEGNWYKAVYNGQEGYIAAVCIVFG